MNDKETTLLKLKEIIAPIWKEREWDVLFHTPKNLSMNIVSEATELMDHFLWSTSRQDVAKELKENRQAIEDELADVFIAAITFALAADIDIAQALEKKLEAVKKKYPVELAKGKSTKYTKLQQAK